MAVGKPRPAHAMPGRQSISIDIAARPGWQRFALIPQSDLAISGAWFERAGRRDEYSQSLAKAF